MKKLVLLLAIFCFTAFTPTFAVDVDVGNLIEKTTFVEIENQHDVHILSGWELKNVDLINYESEKFVIITYESDKFIFAYSSLIIEDYSEEAFDKFKDKISGSSYINKVPIIPKSENRYKVFYGCSSGGLSGNQIWTVLNV